MTNGFKIIGIQTVTTNENGQSAQDLGKLWGQFMSETISKIPNKISEEIIAIYTDFESNYKGSYTAIIGLKVNSLDQIPEGMIGREFPAEKFQKFTAKGEMPNAVMQTWANIWQQDETLNRAYHYDFEVYGEKSQNGDQSEVEIFVSVKKNVPSEKISQTLHFKQTNMSIEQMVHYQSKLAFEMDSWDTYMALQNGEPIVIVDGRSPEAYQQEHIPDAINLWHKEICFNSTESLDKSKIYVCYCDGIGCNASTKTALKLLTLGFQVRELIGGLDWWKRDGYQTNGIKGQAGTEIVCGC